MATKISETLFDTIKIIAQDEVKKGAKYDVTKIFTIIDDTSRDIGKYIVENSTLTFDVYGESNAYYKGDQVRVTIPEGDYSQKKYIIGKHVAEEGKGLIQYASPVSSVLKTSNNVLEEDNRDVKGLIANGEYIFLPLAEIGLNGDNYTNNVSDTLLIQADFQTFLDKYSITQGSYGLKAVVSYDNDENYYDVYNLDSSEMFGNPYMFSIFTTQAKKFKLDTNLSKNITKINLYLYQNNNFSYRDEAGIERPLDPDLAKFPNLLVKDIVINFGIDLYGLDDNTLKLLVSGNNFYNENELTCDLSLVWYNKDNLNSYIGFSDGKYLDDGYTEEKYKENNNIENNDNRYYYYFYKQDAGAVGDVIAGPGWTRIGEGQPQENINYTYDFKTDDFNKQEITFRGILFYNHERFEADNVTIKNAKDLIGDLNNKIEASENGTLVINHGVDSQDVYNVYGADYLIRSRVLSMTSRELLIDMLFPEDSSLDINVLHNSRLVWEVPIRNTMLTVSSEKNTFFTQEIDNNKGIKRYILEKMDLDNDSIDDYHLFYSIADLYSPAKINNNIKCIITTPNGQVYSANKTFVFTQSETYGTKYVLTLYPMPDSPIAFVSGEASKMILGVGLWDENGVAIPIYSSKNTISSEYAIEPIITFDTNIDDATAVFVEYITDNSEAITAIELTSSPNLVDGAIINFSINYNGIVLQTNYALPCTSNLDYMLSGATKVIYNNLGTDPIFVQDAYKLFDINNAELEPIFWHTLIDGAIDDENPLYPRLSNNKLVPSNIFIEGLSKEVYIQAYDAVGSLLWSQPIVIEMNRYSNQAVNEWDGILAIDKEAGTVLAPMIGAGKKEIDNSFSGVFMGQIEESEGTKLPTGLYGYNKGELNFGLKNDGTAFFGKSGGGRILLNGNDSTITSASYENGSAGVKIDLDGGADSPFFHIKGSNKNLIYIDDKQYYLQSADFGFDELNKITGLKLDLAKGQLQAGNFLINARPADGGGVVYLNSNPSIGEDYMHIGNTDQYIKFTQDGQLYVTAGNLQISENKFAFNNFTIDDNGLRYIAEGKTLLELGTQNIIQSSNFSNTTGMKIDLGNGSITSHSFALDSNNLKVGTNFFQINTTNLKLNTAPGATYPYWFYVGKDAQHLSYDYNGNLNIKATNFNLSSNNIIMQSGDNVQFTVKNGDDIYFQVGTNGKTIIGGWTVTPNSFSVISAPESDEEKAPYFRSEFVSYFIPNYGSSRNGGDSDDSYIYCEYSYPVAEFTSNAAGGCGLKIGRQIEPLYIARDFGEEGGGDIEENSEYIRNYNEIPASSWPIAPLFTVDGFGNTSTSSMTITGLSGLSFKQTGSVAFEPLTFVEDFDEYQELSIDEAIALRGVPEIQGLKIVGYSGYEADKKPIKIIIEGDLYVKGKIYHGEKDAVIE